MNTTAIIVAGGSGTRMGSILPKQFLLLQGKPVLWYTINSFLSSLQDISIVLVLPKAHWGEGQELVDTYFSQEGIQLVAGGESRFESVQNGLKVVSHEGIVMIHDGVRCLLTTGLIRRCWQHAIHAGSAIPAVTATDSIRFVSGSENKVMNRDNIRLIQTPQAFQVPLLKQAFANASHTQFTDEATVLEAMGIPVFLVEGEYENIKITRPADLILADAILQQRSALE
ncbi:MAG: 2-C-methyl-D-erythritol 4-phosphate cytidylyltransferase [Chitinophagia bacterium]|jgi:2-C-methyl-D-erythritol 4-phosphate cytidylyltransferase